MIKSILFIVVMLILVFSGCNCGESESSQAKWDRLRKDGSNYIVQAISTSDNSGRKVLKSLSEQDIPAAEEMEKWFQDFLSCDIPENDKTLCAEMIRTKANFVQLTAWRMKSDESWRVLAKFLSDMRFRRNPLTSKRRDEIRRSFFSSPSKVSVDKVNELKRFLVMETDYQNAIALAERNTYKAFSRIAEWVPKTRKLKLVEIFIDITGETPKWYKKEMDEAAAGRKAGK